MFKIASYLNLIFVKLSDGEYAIIKREIAPGFMQMMLRSDTVGGARNGARRLASLAKPRATCTFATVLSVLVSMAASAQQLRYLPTNPHFGGSPFNGADLMASAAAQRSHRAPVNTSTSLVSSFVSNLESRVSSQLSQYVTSQLFSQTNAASNTGNFTLGALSVAFVRDATSVAMTVRDVRTGETANVTYPLNMFVP